MFFDKKKKNEELLQHMDELYIKNSQVVKELEKSLEEKLEKKLEKKLAENQEESSRMLRRHSGSLEDILEELQRQGEEKENVTEQLNKMRHREKELVELCILLSGQREMILRKFLAEGVLAEDIRIGWKKQTELMKQDAESLGRRCTFHQIGECGEKADYDSHEILSVCVTGQRELDGTIAEVFSSGYCYQGHIIKKAQVSAYRYENKEDVEDVEDVNDVLS